MKNYTRLSCQNDLLGLTDRPTIAHWLDTCAQRAQTREDVAKTADDEYAFFCEHSCGVMFRGSRPIETNNCAS